MKSNLEIMTKLEIMQEAKFSLMRKEDKTDLERLYLIQLESNMKELEWVLDIMQPMTDNEIKEENAQADIMQGYEDDAKEEPENDSEDNMDL